MSDQENQENRQVDELTLLKQRATTLGVSFSNNIGIETLKERIAEKLAEGEPKEEEVKENTPQVKSKNAIRKEIMAEATKLVRLRITNLDPKKSKWPGEIITVANEYIGTITKFVPFGEVTEEGYHVPNVIYKKLKKRKFLDIRTVKRKGMEDQIIQRWVPEFALEVLPQLTEGELKKLAAAQVASGSLRD